MNGVNRTAVEMGARTKMAVGAGFDWSTTVVIGADDEATTGIDVDDGDSFVNVIGMVGATEAVGWPTAVETTETGADDETMGLSVTSVGLAAAGATGLDVCGGVGILTEIELTGLAGWTEGVETTGGGTSTGAGIDSGTETGTGTGTGGSGSGSGSGSSSSKTGVTGVGSAKN